MVPNSKASEIWTRMGHRPAYLLFMRKVYSLEISYKPPLQLQMQALYSKRFSEAELS